MLRLLFATLSIHRCINFSVSQNLSYSFSEFLGRAHTRLLGCWWLPVWVFRLSDFQSFGFLDFSISRFLISWFLDFLVSRFVEFLASPSHDHSIHRYLVFVPGQIREFSIPRFRDCDILSISVSLFLLCRCCLPLAYSALFFRIFVFCVLLSSFVASRSFCLLHSFFFLLPFFFLPTSLSLCFLTMLPSAFEDSLSSFVSSCPRTEPAAVGCGLWGSPSCKGPVLGKSSHLHLWLAHCAPLALDLPRSEAQLEKGLCLMSEVGGSETNHLSEVVGG